MIPKPKYYNVSRRLILLLLTLLIAQNGFSQSISLGDLGISISEAVIGDTLNNKITSFRNLEIEKDSIDQIPKLDSIILTLPNYTFEDQDLVAKAFGKQAYSYVTYLGDFSKAEFFFLKALNALKSNQKQNTTWIKWTLQQLGNIYTRKGEYTKAELNLIESIDLNLESDDIIMASRGYSDLAIIYFSSGEIEKCIKSCQEGIRLAKLAKSDYADFINRDVLTSAYIKTKNIDEAKNQIDIGIFNYLNTDSESKNDHLERILSRRADLAELEERHDETIKYCDSLNNIYQINYKTSNRREFGKLRNRMAQAYLKLEELEAAYKQISLGLSSISNRPNKLVNKEDLYAENTFEQLFQSLCEYYKLKYSKHSTSLYLDSILATVDKGLYVHQLLNQALVANDSKILNTGDQKIFAGYAIEAIWEKSQLLPLTQVQLDYVESIIDIATGSVLGEILEKRKKLKQHSIDIQNEYKFNQQKIIDLKKMNRGSKKSYRDSIILLMDRNDSIVDHSFYKKDQLYEGNLIAYLSSKQSLYAYVRDHLSRRLIKLSELSKIDSVRKTLLTSITNPENANYTESSKILYDYLISPLNDLPKSFSIIHDAHTMGIPFEILIGEDHQALLLTHNIDYRLNTSITSRKYSSSNSINLISPNYGDTTNLKAINRSEIYPLIYSQKEVSEISTIYQNSEIINDIEKDEMLKLISESEILHYAGHARSSDENGSLILSGSGNKIKEQLEGNLISTTPSNTKLVILSACDTGVGLVVDGEGTLSLARSFIEGGTPQVINSLWAVNDQTTYEIMTNFHKQLITGTPSSESLRLAKIDYLRSHSGEYSHPYYWAGFVLTTATNLPQKSNENLIYCIIAIAIIIGIFFLFKNKTSNL